MYNSNTSWVSWSVSDNENEAMKLIFGKFITLFILSIWLQGMKFVPCTKSNLSSSKIFL